MTHIAEDFNVPINEEQIINYMELVKVLIKQMEKYKIRYFAFYGSLLGIHRHMGFVPWNYKIDISVDVCQMDSLNNAVTELDGSHQLLINRTLRFGTWKFFQSKYARNQTFYHYPFIDIHFRREIKDRKFQDVTFTDTIWDINKTFPLIKRLHKDALMFTPCDMEYVVRKLYGPTSNCISSLVSSERRTPITVPCDILKPFYPFTTAESIKGKFHTVIVESLMLNKTLLKTVKYSVPNHCTDIYSFFDSNIELLLKK